MIFHLDIFSISPSLDPNRDVVIVTRAPISDDLLEYYNKLLGLTTAIETGQAENQCSISSRYRIIVPEAIKYFHVSYCIIITNTFGLCCVFEFFQFKYEGFIIALHNIISV